jgi:hypothetical protein
MFDPPSEVVRRSVDGSPESILKLLDAFYTVCIDGHYLFFDESVIHDTDQTLHVHVPGQRVELEYLDNLEGVGNVLAGIRTGYFDPRFEV